LKPTKRRLTVLEIGNAIEEKREKVKRKRNGKKSLGGLTKYRGGENRC